MATLHNGYRVQHIKIIGLLKTTTRARWLLLKNRHENYTRAAALSEIVSSCNRVIYLYLLPWSTACSWSHDTVAVWRHAGVTATHRTRTHSHTRLTGRARTLSSISLGGRRLRARAAVLTRFNACRNRPGTIMRLQCARQWRHARNVPCKIIYVRLLRARSGTP